MKASLNKKEVVIFGSGYKFLTKVIAEITNLCGFHKISVDDIKMTALSDNSFSAVFSSKFYPESGHIFWEELSVITDKYQLVYSVIGQEN